jgi:tRNA (guanosine-2'-O-)-methyltransferase
MKNENVMNTNKSLLQFLSQFVSDHKKELMEKVLDKRTRHLTVVLEDIFQSQNASAVIRTCECLGIQDVHIIESRSKYGTNLKVLKGSHNWVNIIKHKFNKKEGPKVAFDELKKSGYKILVTSVFPGSQSIYEINPIELGKIALVLGNELHGASPEANENADGFVHIPMVGFTESFNVSVSAAICISTLVNKIRASDMDWKLSEMEKDEIRLSWVRSMVKRSDVLERNFLKTLPT